MKRMTNLDFEKGVAYAKAKESMRFHLFLGYGIIIFLGFYVITSIFRHHLDDIGFMVGLLVFGLISLWLGYDEKKEIDKEDKR